MELDDLKMAWSEYGRRLDRNTAQIGEMRRHQGLKGIRSRLRLMTRGQLGQLAVGLVVTFWGGNTWVEHWGTWHLVAYGATLHLYGLALLLTASVQLRRIAAIDYAGSVAASQEAIVRLKRSQLRSDWLLLALGGIAWVPALALLLRNAGFDLWMVSPGAVLANLGVGLVASAGLTWASMRHPEWFERTTQHRHLKDVERELQDLGDTVRD